MNVNVPRHVPTDAKVIRIHCRVSDEFSVTLLDAGGTTIVRTVAEQADGAVPHFFPGPHPPDWIDLDIDIETGRILNWRQGEELARKVQEWVDEVGK